MRISPFAAGGSARQIRGRARQRRADPGACHSSISFAFRSNELPLRPDRKSSASRDLREVEVGRDLGHDLAVADDARKHGFNALFEVVFELLLESRSACAVAAESGSVEFFESVLPLESTITTSATSMPSTARATRLPIP